MSGPRLTVRDVLGSWEGGGGTTVNLGGDIKLNTTLEHLILL